MACGGFFLAGFGANPAITLHYSFINEFSCNFLNFIQIFKIEGKFREYISIGIQVFYGIAEILLVPIAYAYPHWRGLALYVFAIPMVIVNLGIFLVYESPKFAFERDAGEGMDILNKIAKINKNPPLELNKMKSFI